MDYRILVLFGMFLTVVMCLISSKKAAYYKTAYTEEEKQEFQKPFRFRFWLVFFISSVTFMGVFMFLGIRISMMLKAV